MKSEELLSTKEKANKGSLIAQKILFEHFYAEEKYGVALKWARKAAEQGNARAEYLIGNCYASGKGVAENIKEAVKWFARASEKGNADAMFGLARCHLLGEGVAVDLDKALELIESAEINIDARDICKLMEYKAVLMKKLKRWEEYVEIVNLFSQQGLGCTSCNFIDNYDEKDRTCPWMVSETKELMKLLETSVDKPAEENTRQQSENNRDSFSVRYVDHHYDRYDDYDDDDYYNDNQYDDGLNWDYYDDNLDMDQQSEDFWG